MVRSSHRLLGAAALASLVPLASAGAPSGLQMAYARTYVAISTDCDVKSLGEVRSNRIIANSE
jgi:hypothetical protein